MEKQISNSNEATKVVRKSDKLTLAPEKTIKGEIVHVAYEKVFGLKRTHIVTLLDYVTSERCKVYITCKQSSEYQYSELLRIGRKVNVTVALAAKDTGYEMDGKLVAFEGTGNVFRSMSALSDFECRQLRITSDIGIILSNEEANRREIASYLSMVQ